MLKKYFMILISLSMFNCSSQKKFESKLTEKNCDAALQEIPENQPGYKMISKSQEITGTVLSYAATGSAYTVEVLWDTAATVGAVVVLCAPGMVANTAGSVVSQGQASPVYAGCFPGDITAVHAPAWGRKTRARTKNWNCPNVDAISQSIRRVAQCYTKHDTVESRHKAELTLQSLQNSKSFYECLSSVEKDSIKNDLSKI